MLLCKKVCDSRVIPELQFNWVGSEIVLLFEIGLVVFSHEMIEQGDGDY